MNYSKDHLRLTDIIERVVMVPAVLGWSNKLTRTDTFFIKSTYDLHGSGVLLSSIIRIGVQEGILNSSLTPHIHQKYTKYGQELNAFNQL